MKQAFQSSIQEHFETPDLIAGVATGAIAQGALVADTMQLPFVYVRPSAKEHGRQNLIEGRLLPGQKVVVVEDLISTGGSSLKAVEALRKAGADVLGMVAIFSYGFEVAIQNFNEADENRLAVISRSIALSVIFTISKSYFLQIRCRDGKPRKKSVAFKWTPWVAPA